jgi:hypothetical protein
MESAATNQMHMHVEYGLAGSWPDVQHGAISIFDGAITSDAGGGKVTEPNQFGILRRRFLESGDVFLGDDQHVSWALGIQIFECKYIFVFIDFLGRHLSANDAAEKTIGHDYFSLSSAEARRLRVTLLARRTQNNSIVGGVSANL